jgi:hypothetical protein
MFPGQAPEEDGRVGPLMFGEGPFCRPSKVRVGCLCEADLALQARPFLSQPLLDHLFKLRGGNKRDVAIGAGLMLGFSRESLNALCR